jgi:hypothetical protein
MLVSWPSYSLVTVKICNRSLDTTPAFRAEFHILNFDDFDESELWEIFCKRVYERFDGKEITIEDGITGLYTHIAIRRLSRTRGIKGFGNSRAVENMLSKIVERQAKRITK